VIEILEMRFFNGDFQFEEFLGEHGSFIKINDELLREI
jgi:hypothetical protein